MWCNPTEDRFRNDLSASLLRQRPRRAAWSSLFKRAVRSRAIIIGDRLGRYNRRLVHPASAGPVGRCGDKVDCAGADNAGGVDGTAEGDCGVVAKRLLITVGGIAPAICMTVPIVMKMRARFALRL